MGDALPRRRERDAEGVHALHEAPVPVRMGRDVRGGVVGAGLFWGGERV